MFDEINRLGQYEIGTSLERWLGSESDVSLVSKDEVEMLPQADATGQQVRYDDVAFTLPSDVTGGQDGISIEQNKQAYNADADNISDLPNEDTAGVVTDDDMKLNVQKEVLIPADNGAVGDVEVKLTDVSVRLNVDEPSQSSHADFVEESSESSYGQAAKCNDSIQTVDIENPFQRQSMNNRLPAEDEEKHSSCTQRSASPAQANDLVVSEQSSDSLMTDSPDFESNSAAPTASSECMYELSLSPNDSTCSSDIEAVKRTNESNEMRDVIKPASTVKTCGEPRDASKSELDDSIDDQQSPANEDITETSTVQTSSAAEAESISLNTADDESSSISSKVSHQGTESNRQIAELIAADDGDRSYDLEDTEVLEGVGEATRSEEMNNSLANSSSSRVHSLSKTNSTTYDEEGCNKNDSSSEVSCLQQPGETNTTLSSSSASSSLLMPSVKDEIATAQLKAFNSDQTPRTACEDTLRNETRAEIAPRLPSPRPPFHSSPLSSSPSASLSVYSQMEKGAGLEEYCLRQGGQSFASVREDTAPSETDARSPSPPLSPPSPASSSLSPSSSLSSSPSSSSLVNNDTIRSSESQRSVAESAEDRCKFDSMNEAVSESQPDHGNNFEVVPLSHSSAAQYQAHVSRDPCAVAKIKGTADLSENFFVSQTSDLQRMNNDKTALVEQSELLSVSNAEPTESKPQAANLPVSFEKNTDGVLNNISRTQNTFSTESTVSEDQQLETKAEQTEDEQNRVDVGRKGPRTGTDATMSTELESEELDLPPLPLSHPPPPLITPFSDDDLNCSVDDVSHSESVNSSGKAFTSVSTLYFQSPAVKDNLAVCTSNSNNTSNACASTTLSEDHLPEGSSAEKERFLSAFNGVPAAFRRAGGSEDYEVVTERSDNRENEECRSSCVEENLMTPSNGVHDIIRIDVPSRSKHLPATMVKLDTEVVTKKSESHDDLNSSTSARNSTVRSRPAASVAAKRNTLTCQTPTSDRDSNFVGTVTKSTTAIDALVKQEHESAVDKVDLKSGGGSSSAASSGMNSCDESKNSSECKTNQLHALTGTTDNGDHSSVQDRIRAHEKERAKRVLQSFLTPICRNTGLPSRAPKPPVVNGNEVNASLAAGLRETTTSRESVPSNNVIRDSGLSTKDERTNEKTRYYPGPTAPRRPPGVVRRPFTAPKPGGYRDNNNNRPATERNVIKPPSPTTRRSRGDKPSSWQQKQVPYDVATLPRSQRSFKHLSSGNDQNNQHKLVKQLSEESSHVDLTTLGAFPAECGGVVFRRSLSLPVIDRSEAFIVTSATAADRDRVRLPHRAPLSPPPTRFKSTNSALSAVSEHEN